MVETACDGLIYFQRLKRYMDGKMLYASVQKY